MTEPVQYYLLEDGRVCKYISDICGARQYSALTEDTYEQQLLLFRRNNPISNIGIKRVREATYQEDLLNRQRLWDKRYFEKTGKIYLTEESDNAE